MPATANSSSAAVESVSVHEAIYSRRSTRKYLSKPVLETQVRALLEAAIHAPSAMNNQPWAFAVIQSAESLKRLSDAVLRDLPRTPDWLQPAVLGEMPPNNGDSFDIFYGATTLIVICANNEPGFSPVGDCYLAAQNLMLAAYEMGLATCPVGLARDVLSQPSWRNELAIPASYKPVLPVIVGYATAIMPDTVRSPARIFSWQR